MLFYKVRKEKSQPWCCLTHIKKEKKKDPSFLYPNPGMRINSGLKRSDRCIPTCYMTEDVRNFEKITCNKHFCVDFSAICLWLTAVPKDQVQFNVDPDKLIFRGLYAIHLYKLETVPGQIWKWIYSDNQCKYFKLVFAILHKYDIRIRKDYSTRQTVYH